MDGRMFDGMVRDLILVGIAIGVALCGLGYGVWWVSQHLSISWVW